MTGQLRRLILTISFLPRLRTRFVVQTKIVIYWTAALS